MSKILLEDIPSVIHQHMRCPLIEPSLYYVYLCIILRWWKNHLVRHWLHIMESALIDYCLKTEKSSTSRSADINWGWKIQFNNKCWQILWIEESSTRTSVDKLWALRSQERLKLISNNGRRSVTSRTNTMSDMICSSSG